MTGLKRAVLRLLFWTYVPLAVMSILVIPLGAVGLIKNDPFMTVLAMVLGLPWSVVITWLIDTPSDFVNVILLAVALAINAGLLRFASHRRRDHVIDDGEAGEADEDDWEDEEESESRR